MRAIFIGGPQDGTRLEIPDEHLATGIVRVPSFNPQPFLPATDADTSHRITYDQYYVKTFMLEDGPIAILAHPSLTDHYGYLARLIRRYPKPRKKKLAFRRPI
jgi:hypothetical protein